MAGSPLVMMQVNAVIDSRTTVVCLHANGLMAEAGDVFHTLAGDFYHPPFHVHCRSVIRPWQPGYVSKAREEANKELQRRPKRERRIGPGGEIGGAIPGPVGGNPPVGPVGPSPAQVARDARVAAKKAQLEKLIAAALLRWLRGRKTDNPPSV